MLPPPGPFHYVDTPVCVSSRSRIVGPIPTSCIWARLQLEVEQSEQLRDAIHSRGDPPDVAQTAGYNAHPKVQAARIAGAALILPLADYMDGVAFTSGLGGRSDALIGIWVINLFTSKRHMYAMVRSLDMCRCGCNGWCSLFPLFSALAWQLIAIQTGTSPPRRHDLTMWGAEDTLGIVTHLAYTAYLHWVKGDWAEFAKTLALTGWASWINPCFPCHATQAELHSLYISCLQGRLPFIPREDDSYDLECRSCEIRVEIDTIVKRTSIVASLVWMPPLETNGRAAY